MRAILVATLAIIAAGCAEETCDVPATGIAYTCDPQASSANACEGGPTLDGAQHDVGKNYPVGCFAGVPACVDGNKVIDDCECISGFAGNTWACRR